VILKVVILSNFVATTLLIECMSNDRHMSMADTDTTLRDVIIISFSEITTPINVSVGVVCDACAKTT